VRPPDQRRVDLPIRDRFRFGGDYAVSERIRRDYPTA
jgi:hypothetical protein